MPEQDKSILDGIKIKEEGFPLGSPSAPGDARHVVSKCPVCGAPIYGPERTTAETPNVVFSCNCRYNKTIQETMQTK